MKEPTFTACLSAPSADGNMPFESRSNNDDQTTDKPATYNQYGSVAITSDTSRPPLISKLRQASAKDHTYSACITEERTATTSDVRISPLKTDDISLYGNTSVIVIRTDNQPLPSTSMARDEAYLLITPGSHQTKQMDATKSLSPHVMASPVTVPVASADCSAIDPGENVDSFISCVTNENGKLFSTPITDQYFSTVSEEQYNHDKTRFINQLKSEEEQKKYKTTLQLVRRKFKNKASAQKARTNKEAIKNMLYDYAVESKKVIAQSKNLVRELNKHFRMSDFQRNEALTSTLENLENVLDNAPEINL